MPPTLRYEWSYWANTKRRWGNNSSWRECDSCRVERRIIFSSKFCISQNSCFLGEVIVAELFRWEQAPWPCSEFSPHPHRRSYSKAPTFGMSWHLLKVKALALSYCLWFSHFFACCRFCPKEIDCGLTGWFPSTMVSIWKVNRIPPYQRKGEHKTLYWGGVLAWRLCVSSSWSEEASFFQLKHRNLYSIFLWFRIFCRWWGCSLGHGEGALKPC